MLIKEIFKIRKGKKAIESTQDERYIQIEDLRNNDNIKYAKEDSKNI